MVNIVYLVIAYKNLEQMIRLVNRLNAPNVQFLIHIDKKSDEDYLTGAQRALRDYPNCYFIKRETVYWGAWGLTQVSLNAIHYIEAHDLKCDFLIYMSGQDYPLQSNDRIHAFFENHRGKQFLDHFTLPYENWPGRGGLNRVELYHFQLGGKTLVYPPFAGRDSPPRLLKPIMPFFPFKPRKLPGGYRFYGGSAAIILARNGITYIDQFVKTDLGQRIVNFYTRTANADEMFFQTVMMNSSMGNTVVNDELRFTDWSKKGAHPEILTKHDYQRLKDSGHLFARKFDVQVDAEILDLLDEGSD
jgi:hypothetical protein